MVAGRAEAISFNPFIGIEEIIILNGGGVYVKF